MVLSSSARSFNLVCLPFFTGRNPSKINFSNGKPEITKAGTNAVAPGKHSTLISRFKHSRTNKNPGSEIPGVPASEIKAMVSPSFNLTHFHKFKILSFNESVENLFFEEKFSGLKV
jgi:hypothetical protein